MKEQKSIRNRRDFLKKVGISSLPFLIPSLALGKNSQTDIEEINTQKVPVYFYSDGNGLSYSPHAYLQKLNEINKEKPIQLDFYGNGGSTSELEKEFAKITDKEKAIYLPTGTMANQIAIKLLNEEKTKVIVPENSHVFRDEADAAQSVHNKRLIPIGKGKHYFDLNDLKNSINYLNRGEVFKSGLGTVVIENPVRRADGRSVPLKTIKEISNYCKSNGYRLHLDGARIHLASAYTDVSIVEYASYFDTVYISLYKYLNATGGAILCGDAEFIDQISHQIKIHGGTMYQNWNNTSIALHYLNGINKRWKRVVKSTNELISELNKINGISIKKLNNGTNIYDLQFGSNIDFRGLANSLSKNYNIKLRRISENGFVKFSVNESLLSINTKDMINIWKKETKKFQR